MKEVLFVLLMANSPTDHDLVRAEAMALFDSDFECSEVEADLEEIMPDKHIFCTDLKSALKLIVDKDPMP